MSGNLAVVMITNSVFLALLVFEPITFGKSYICAACVLLCRLYVCDVGAHVFFVLRMYATSFHAVTLVCVLRKVIDNGTGYTKMGFAGNPEPQHIIPTAIACGRE